MIQGSLQVSPGSISLQVTQLDFRGFSPGLDLWKSKLPEKNSIILLREQGFGPGWWLSWETGWGDLDTRSAVPRSSGVSESFNSFLQSPFLLLLRTQSDFLWFT